MTLQISCRLSRRAWLCLALLLAAAGAARVAAQTTTASYARALVAVSFANLGTAFNGSIRYCLNCSQSSPCASGGTGAVAVRRAGAWECSGSLASIGDGSQVAMWEMRELSANGNNRVTIFGPAAIAADRCTVWPDSEPTDGQVLGDLGSTVTVDGLTCRRLGWVSASVAGCTSVAGELTCPGGFSSGAGTAPALWRMPELSANGNNFVSIYGPRSVAADSCVVWPAAKPSATGQVLASLGTTQTEDGIACEVLGWTTPAAPGGGAATLAAGSCFVTTSCAPPVAALGAVTPGNGYTPTPPALRVHVIQVVLPYSGTFTSLAVRAAGGGTAGSRFVLGGFDNAPGNAPGNVLGSCFITDTTAAGPWKSCTVSFAFSAGVPFWIAVAVEDITMAVRGFGGEFSNAFTDFLSLSTPGRIGYCANLATAGGSLTLPASCGAFTARAWPVPMVLALP